MNDHGNFDTNFDPSDPIVAAWSSQSDRGPNLFLKPDPAALADSVAKAHQKDQRRLLWLNVREFLPALVVASVFVSDASGSARPLAVVAAAIMVMVAGCYLALNSVRHQRADRGFASSVREQLERRRAQLDHRAVLLRNTWWWYFLPFGVAISLYYYGTGGGIPTSDDSGFIALWIGVLAIGYLFNRWVGRTQYETEAKRYEALLAEFDRAV